MGSSSFALPNASWRDRIGVALILAGGAFILWHPAARWLWELLPQASALYAMGCVLVLQAAHAVWWHARQQRRRAAQRARLSATPPRVVTR